MSDNLQSSLEEKHWHTLDISDIFTHLDVNTDGLSESEALQRQSIYGKNRLPGIKRRGAWARLLSQFHNVLIYVLLVAGIITALLGHIIDSGVIVAVVIINALIGFVQEGKAEKAR